MEKADVLHLYLPVFIAGSISLLVEIAGSRAIAPYVGSTIYSWAAVIGFVLAALSAGYYTGGKLADRYRSRKQLALIFLAAAISTLLVPFLAMAVGPFTLFTGFLLANLFGAAILLPASFFYGMISPYAIKLSIEQKKEGEVAGSIFALSTVGSILGVLATGFILIPSMQLTHVFVLGSALMLLGSWLVAKNIQWLDLAAWLPITLLLTSVSFSYYSGTIVYETESQYYHIAVIDGEYNDEAGRFLVLDNAPSSGEKEDGSPLFDYVIEGAQLYELAENKDSALVLGVGAGTQVEDLKRRYPSMRVDGVEIDPALIDIGKHYFSLEEDGRTRLFIEDGRRYLANTDTTYDIIVVDVYRSHSIPYNLITREFVSLLKKRLSLGGIVIVNVVERLENEGSPRFHLIYSTYAHQFDDSGALIIGPLQRVFIAADHDLPATLVRPNIREVELTDEWNPIEVY